MGDGATADMVGALVTSATDGTSPAARAVGTVDQLVARAFALGWQMAEFNRVQPAAAPDPPPPAAAHADGHLPGVDELQAAQRETLGRNQVAAALTLLGPAIDAVGLEENARSLGTIVEHLGRRDTNETVSNLHARLLCCLTAADSRLGRAYDLGRMLCEMASDVKDVESLRAQLDANRVLDLSGRLAALTTALPENAGHAVRASLIYWQQWLDQVSDDVDVMPAVAQFPRQARAWRALLSGEQQARDGLSLEDFAATAGNMLLHARVLAWHFLKHCWLLALVIVLLFASGIAILIASSGAHDSLAGIGALLASAGLSWKTVGTTLAGTADHLRRPVWDAELDEAIAYAITAQPVRETIDREPPGRARKLGRQLTSGTHVARATVPLLPERSGGSPRT